MGAPDQPVEPMFQACKGISLEFCGYSPDTMNPNAFGASTSLSASANRCTPFAIMVDSATVMNDIATHSLIDDTAIAKVVIDRDWDGTSKTVTGTVHVTFEASPGSGDYRIGLYTVEDSVTGPDPNYSQYDDAALPVWPVLGFVHPWVLRGEILANSFWGLSGVIPSDPVAGVEYDAPFNYTLPDLYYDIAPKPEHIALNAFVVKKNSNTSGQIYNCESAPLVGTSSPIINGKGFLAAKFGARFANGVLLVNIPVGVSKLSICSVDGRELKSFVTTAGTLKNFRIEGLGSGVYFATAGSNTARFVLTR